jgi:uncharacterized membrane protein
MKSAQSLGDLTQQNVKLIAHMEEASEVNRALGERVADFLAAWVGSWTFLIIQSGFLAGWIAVNAVGWWMQWDPFPFVLLNLVLSCQAAFAMPIILMSQNRQARLAERRNHLDLQINLLTEQENTEQLRLLRLLCENAGIGMGQGRHTAFEEATSPPDIVQQIKDHVEPKKQQGRARR